MPNNLLLLQHEEFDQKFRQCGGHFEFWGTRRAETIKNYFIGLRAFENDKFAAQTVTLSALIFEISRKYALNGRHFEKCPPF